MKLCRFELKSAPGEARSGIVYGGKIYETNGAEAIGVHEAEAVRPLAPTQNPGSIRFFRNTDRESLSFFYGNPMSLVGTSQLVNFPLFTTELTFEPYLAAVVVDPGYDLDVAEADDNILGLTILNVLVAKDVERQQGGAGGRSHDIAATIGPVLTTSDELDEAVIDSENGRRYGLGVTARVNGVEIYRGNVEDLRTSFAEAVSFASQSCTLRSGDVFAIGPIIDTDEAVVLRAGDEVQIAVERLGMLSTKLSQPE